MTCQLAERAQLTALPGAGAEDSVVSARYRAAVIRSIRPGRCAAATGIRCQSRFATRWRTWRSGREANGRAHQQVVLQAIAAARLAQLPGWRRQHIRLWLLLKA